MKPIGHFTQDELDDSLSITELADLLGLSYVYFCKYFQHRLIPFIGTEMSRRVKTEVKDILVELREKHGDEWYKHLPWPNHKGLSFGSCVPNKKRGPYKLHSVKQADDVSPVYLEEKLIKTIEDSFKESTLPISLPKQKETPELKVEHAEPHKENSSKIAERLYQRAKEFHKAGKFELACELFMIVGEFSD